jgi:hypothetical protein
MTFRVGQKVVCIDASGGALNWGGKRRPVLGAVYTVRSVYRQEDEPEGILLEEIINQLHPCGDEYGFRARRFRPIVERKTDISIFTAMLKTDSVPA